MPTIAEWTKLQDRDNDVEVGIIEEAVKSCPEFKNLNFRPIKGTSYKIYQRNQLAKGGFRELNTGVTTTVNGGVQKTIEAKFYDSCAVVDEAMVMGDLDSLGDTMTLEESGLMLGNMQDIAQQIYYGNYDPDNGDLGFDGFNSQLDSVMDLAANSTVSSGTSYTGVYFVNSGLRGSSIIGGNNTSLMLGDLYQEDVKDDDGKEYRAWKQRMRGWYGLQVASKYAVGKISKITDELTQEMMATMLGLFPIAFRPNQIYMNRATYYNIWLPERAKVGIITSGSTTLDVKKGFEDATADSFMGIPIFVTDSIKDDETPESTSSDSSSSDSSSDSSSSGSNG